MADRRDEGVREVRLEGAGLVLLLAFLAVAVVGAFLAGRWWEARQHPSERAALGLDADDPLAGVDAVKEPAEVGDDLDYFDTVEGAGKEAEPQREARRSDRPADPPADAAPAPAPSTAPSTPSATAPGGDFYVQVAAVRDESSADALVQRLQRAGFPVRLFAEREGSRTLYRVRVGGFPDRAAADAAVGRLDAAGYPGAFVKQIE